MDHVNSIIVGHLNINLIRNKFILSDSIIKTFDLLVIVESKQNSTFPMHQFRIHRNKIFRRDHNQFGGGYI